MTKPIGRRDFIGLLGTAAVASAQSAPKFSYVDHLEFFVADVEKSTAFYARVFGNTVLKNNRTTRRYVKLGSAYIAIDTGQEIRVDHVCAGIPNFDIAAMHAFLDQRGIMYRDYPSGRDTAITDPDGSRLQLATDNGWTAAPGSPESIAIGGEPIFRPTGIDHVLLNVTDPEKSAAFYEKVLGPVAQKAADRIWFQVGSARIGVTRTPAGDKAGVNHWCVAAAAFDTGAAKKRLEQTGAKLAPTENANDVQFRDPDGYLVQVLSRA